MVMSQAATIKEYLEELPEDRRAVVSAVRKLVNRHLQPGFVEALQYGMLAWAVPLEQSGPTYNGQPLCGIALAAQKNSISLYLMSVYGSEVLRAEFERGFREAGKRLDMGKSCVRFRALDDLALDAVERAVRSTRAADLIAAHHEAHSAHAKQARRAAKKAAAKKAKPAVKTAAKRKPAAKRAAAKVKPARPARAKPAKKKR